MLLKIFSLLDTKVQTFAAPFTMAHVGYAIRACAELGQDLNTTVGRHPADFMLFELGEFNDQTGSCMPHAVPINHGPVLAFLPKPPSTPLEAEIAFDERKERAAAPNGHAR